MEGILTGSLRSVWGYVGVIHSLATVSNQLGELGGGTTIVNTRSKEKGGRIRGNIAQKSPHVIAKCREGNGVSIRQR